MPDMPTSNDISPPRESARPADPEVAEVNLTFVRPPSGAHRVSLWIMRLAGQLRRQYLSRLRPGYVRQAREDRQSECRRCGSCCNLTFNCPFFDATVGCKIYEKRPLTCRDFPIDARDLRITRVPCGHHYEHPKEGNSRANSPR
jgi:hypothetical protein